MFEREIRDTAYVPRWSIIRTTRPQSIAEHMYFVAIYADQIAETLHYTGDRAQLIRVALTHDWPEILTGDIAAPAKRVMKEASKTGWNLVEKWEQQQTTERIPDFQRMYAHLGTKGQVEHMELIVKVADLLEAVVFLADEENSGNGNVMACRSALESIMWDAVARIDFGTIEQRKKLKKEMENAILSARVGHSKVVFGNEKIK